MDMDDTSRPGFPYRRIAYTALLLGLVIALVEGAAFGVQRWMLGDAAGDELAQDNGAASADGAVPQEAPAPDVRAGRERAGLGFQDPSLSLHPFLGYVFTPKTARDAPAPAGISISEDGFLDDRPAIRKRRDGALIIGLLGGSVTGQLGSFHLAHLRRALARYPEFADHELEFVRLGMPGYHQPQQVIQLAWILAQGGEFDLLINLDGFNEIAVPAALNAPQGAHPLFPMNWSMVALDAPEPAVRRALGAIAYLKEERRERTARFADSIFAHTQTGRLLWRLADRELERKQGQFAWELQQFAADEIPFFVRGPERDHQLDGGLLPWCVDVWKRSSLQLQVLCDSHGIRYHHVLQPNQYLPGSKPLSSDELEQAVDADGPYRPVVEEGYPRLRAAGRQLRESGVAFHDLSMVFEDVPTTLYVDSCCHFNSEGNRILCEAMAAAIHGG